MLEMGFPSTHTRAIEKHFFSFCFFFDADGYHDFSTHQIPPSNSLLVRKMTKACLIQREKSFSNEYERLDSNELLCGWWIESL